MRIQYLSILLAVATAIMPACKHADPDKPHVVIQTQAGDIEVELYPRRAPRTAGAFLSYVGSGFYKNGSFYRVLNDDNQVTGADKSQLIQGGIWENEPCQGGGLTGGAPRNDPADRAAA